MTEKIPPTPKKPQTVYDDLSPHALENQRYAAQDTGTLYSAVLCIFVVCTLALILDNFYTNYQLRVRLDALEQDKKALYRAEARASAVTKHLQFMLQRSDWKDQSEIP